jgi:hypothetical protein
MSSKKKIAANRANAQKSTGPKTQAGKEASRRNSLVHGLTAEVLLLDHEDPAEFEALRDAIYAEYLPPEPRDALSLEFADRLAMTLWRMRRIPAFERALIAWMTHRMHVTHDGPSGEMPGPKPTKGMMPFVPTGLSLTKSTQDDGAVQRLRIGRALEALLETNALGKLDSHQARLCSDLKYQMDWLELQKRARVGYQASRTASGKRIDPEPEVIPPRIVPPSVPGGSAFPTTGAGSTDAPALSTSWHAASERGGYVSSTEREARKQQEALLKGGSANTAGG